MLVVVNLVGLLLIGISLIVMVKFESCAKIMMIPLFGLALISEQPTSEMTEKLEIFYSNTHLLWAGFGLIFLGDSPISNHLWFFLVLLPVQVRQIIYSDNLEHIETKAIGVLVYLAIFHLMSRDYNTLTSDLFNKMILARNMNAELKDFLKEIPGAILVIKKVERENLDMDELNYEPVFYSNQLTSLFRIVDKEPSKILP